MRLIYFDIDTLRPDHLGCYGYKRNTSPNIDKIAAKGTIFNNYYCSDAPCLPSRVSMITGIYGIHTGVVSHAGTAADIRLEGAPRNFKMKGDQNQLAYVCRKGGMHTVCISPFAERHSCYMFYAGFNEIINTGNSGRERADEIAPYAIKWIDENGKNDNWYLHVNMWDPHTEYRTPVEYGNPFENDPIPDWITPEVFEQHKKCVGPHSPCEIGKYDKGIDNKVYPRYPGEIHDMAGVKKMFDGYDCGIKYADDYIGKILDSLDRQGVLEDTAIIVSADHGENMGEWGIYGEHATADNGTCHIPMVFYVPSGHKGHVDDLHLNIDLVPTIADMLNVPPYEKWDGISYKNTLLNGDNAGREDAVISQCAHGCQRSVLFGDYMYVRTYQDGFHLLPDELLYNIKKDPHQQHDLSKQLPDILHEGAYRLMHWHDDMMRTSDSQIDPMWTVFHEDGPIHASFRKLRPYLKWLHEQGRLEDEKALRDKYNKLYHRLTEKF